MESRMKIIWLQNFLETVQNFFQGVSYKVMMFLLIQKLQVIDHLISHSMVKNS